MMKFWTDEEGDILISMSDVLPWSKDQAKIALPMYREKPISSERLSELLALAGEEDAGDDPILALHRQFGPKRSLLSKLIRFFRGR